MIIKRTLKVEMPSLKRCKLEESDGEADYEYSANAKKPRAKGYYSLCNGDVEGLSSGSGSSYNEESYWNGEVESNLMALNGRRDGFGKSSRGRVRMLPSKFNNSVLNYWKKKEPKSEETDTSFIEEDNNVKIFVEDGNRNIDELVSNRKKEKYRLKKPKLEPRELDCVGIDNFEYGKYIGLKPLVGNEEYASGLGFSGVERLEKPNVEKRKETYKPEDFALGDIVWAKCGRSFPAWPAVVIDPLVEAPEQVLRCCVPGAICVMFYGFSKNGTQRDYGWVKQGMVFPFHKFMDRFRGQTHLYKSKPSEFQMAIEEALLAENGFLGKGCGTDEITTPEAYPCETPEPTTSNQGQEFYSRSQAISL